jgi:hypothetical protein
MHSTEIGIRGEKVRGVTSFLARRSGAACVLFCAKLSLVLPRAHCFVFALPLGGNLLSLPSSPKNVRLVRYSTDFSYRYTWTRFTALEMKLPRPD